MDERERGTTKMDKNSSNTNVELIIDKDSAHQLVDDARSFSNQCCKAIKNMGKAHLEEMKKKKGIKESNDDDKRSDQELYAYVDLSEDGLDLTVS